MPEDRYVNVVTDVGCRDVGLPATYPRDGRRRILIPCRCQPIGLRAREDGLPGVAARSAVERTARSSPTSGDASSGAERCARSRTGSGNRFANNASVSDQRHPGGLSSQEAARRLHQLGPVEDRSSRSVASIVAGNVFTLFNLIIGVFFVIMLALGLFADALFGFIAVINSYIGIRQELKAKETLESLALLVAPKAKVVRDGELVELRAEEIVPGDWIRVEPGDQLVADGEVTESRGLTVDESVLTGEADGVRKRVGQPALSGAFCINGSGYYEVTAVREDSYAEKVAGEARTFRHPPSPLQDEVNLVLKASTWLMIPLAVVLIFALQARSTPLHEAAQTATAGLITLIPEGLVLLMSVTLAVAAVRLARLDTLVQQMSATEALAAVDTICVDKTGTLTSGELELVSVDVSDPSEASAAQQALARFAASSGERNRTLEAIAENYPATGERVRAEVPFSSEWKWSGLSFGRGETYVLGAPDVLMARGSLALPVPLQRSLEANTKAGRRVVAFGRASGGLPDNPYSDPPPAVTPLALIVLEETLRPDARETIRYMREHEMDLKLISGDAPQTVTAVASAVGIPAGAGVVTGDDLPEDHASLARIAEENTIFCRIRPEQKKALVSALAEQGRFVAMIGDGVNDVPALKRARMAVAMGSGSQITKGIADIVLLKDQFSRLPRAISEGRRIARNIHRLGRLYVTKTIYAAALIVLVAIPGWAFPFLPRQLTVAAFLTIGIPSFVLALAPSDGPLYRGRLLRALAAFAVPAGLAIAAASLASFFLVDTVFGGSLEAGRTAATTTLVVLGLCFILLLERGPGREHIAIQSYMLALVAALGALYALILAVAAGARLLRPDPDGRRPALPGPALGGRGPGAGKRRLADPHDRTAGGSPAVRRGPDRAGDGVAFRAADPNPRLGTIVTPSGTSVHVARRTKIVATVGPASSSPEVLRELFAAGVDVFRLNFAHGTPEEQAENVRRIRAVSEEVGREVGIMGDLPGPKLRLGDLEGDVAVLHSGSNVVLKGETNGTPGNAELLTVQWDGFAKAVHEGDPVFLADGRVRLRVVSVEGGAVTCEIEAGGAVSSHQGVNLPGADHDLPETGASDQPWIDFACENGIDLLAVSFVRRPSDLEKVEARLRGARRRHPPDRQDREAAGRRARRGDHRGGRQRDHDRARRPRRRAADRGGPRRAEAADRPRRAEPRSRRSPRPRCWRRWCGPRARRGPR